ncbi:MAG: carboxypeptidase regulatory-like domain-containing protein [Candidatus Sulfotelmatobacter sp.]|jgi:carboxypeptidase family protein
MNSRVFFIVRGITPYFICFLIVFVGIAAFGQAGRGGISGTITDSNGAVVAGAQIVLLNSATGVALHTTTSSAGLYSFVSLNPGNYQVTATQNGFAKVVRNQITVNLDEITEINLTLKVGAASETVTITAGSELVEPSNSTVGSLIPAEQIDRVPLLYRNVYDLIQLSAGVIPVNGSPNSSDSMQSIQNISFGRPGVDVSADTINGSLTGSVYYMLDGSPLGVAENNAAAIIPAMNIPEDGVEEVRVETQNTPASYQSGAAGVISLVSKSGTNKIHGDVFGVFRPNVLSANDYFSKEGQLASGQKNTPPNFHRYQEGAAIGGPIKKDKLFFFGDYEDTQQVQFEGVDTFSVPTAAERTGDFSQMGFTIYNPTLPDVGGVRQPFAGNKIPNPNPIGLLYLGNMPKCNYPDPVSCEQATSDVVNNFQMPGLDPYHAHRFDVRLDWNPTEKQRIFTRFSYDKLNFSTANVFPTPGWDINYAENITNGRNILVADDITLNASTVLNLRYSFTRRYENQGNPAYSSTNITNLGTVNGTTAGFPTSLAGQQIYKELPVVLFGDVGQGVGGTWDGNIFRDASENNDANATITKILGKHQLSFGFEWMKRYFNVGQPPSPAGEYEFDTSATNQSVTTGAGGSDYASLLVGMAANPTGANAESNYAPNFSNDIFAAESNPYYATFIEDTYHLSPKLTITAGLRWDIFGGENERFNRLEHFDPNATNTVDGVFYTGAEVFANNSHRSNFENNLHNFGPRLAFAWQPVQHFVMRGGAGIYYGPSTHAVQSADNDSDGFSSNTTWNGACLNSDGNSVFNGTSCGTNTGSAANVFTGAYSLSNPFPSGINPVFTTAPAGLGNNLGIPLSSVLHYQPTPTTYNFNFGLEYELPHQVVVSAAYVGSRGLFLPIGHVDLNQLDLGTINKYQAALTSTMIPNIWEPVLPATNNNYGQATVPLFVGLEKYPQFGNGLYGSGNGVNINGYIGGDSEYSSLQTKVQKRLTGHFTTLATFTWGKLMTDDGNPPEGFVGSHNGSVQDWRNVEYEHSIAPQDVKYQFTGQASYDLPVGTGRGVNLNGAPNAILGGWTLNGILYLSTGVPINSPSSGYPVSYFNQRADMVCNPAKGAPHTPTAWFNVGCFVQPGTENGGVANPFIPGNAPDYLDNVRTRGARDLDLSIYKTFKLGETKALRFDISSYNTTNTPQFGYPNVINLATAAQPGQEFGQITNNVNTPRQFQFGARFTF